MEYELTSKGEKFLETAEEKHLELLGDRDLGGGKFRPASSSFYRLNRRLEMLSRISRGQDPVVSFEFLPESQKSRKAGAYSAIRKELSSILKAGLIKEVPGWEQKIQYDLGMRHPSQITASQEEYEKPMPRSYFYGVSGSKEEVDYRQFVGDRIEGSVSGRAIEGLYSLGTRDLEDLYSSLKGSQAIEDWNKKKSKGM